MVSGPKAKMPKDAEKPLSNAEVASLEMWIDSGANWPDKTLLKAEQAKPSLDWWSLKPVVRPNVPKVKNTDGIRNPIDAFIRARLEAEGLAPSKEADRLTLIRRLTFDLHGLPPTPEEVDAFVKDTRPDAYEKLVDRLLASPRYGERWGRHWLDVVHYGDTHGYDRDKRAPNGWPYRDYVIRSLQRRQAVLAGSSASSWPATCSFPSDQDAHHRHRFHRRRPVGFRGHIRAARRDHRQA